MRADVRELGFVVLMIESSLSLFYYGSRETRWFAPETLHCTLDLAQRSRVHHLAMGDSHPRNHGSGETLYVD